MQLVVMLGEVAQKQKQNSEEIADMLLFGTCNMLSEGWFLSIIVAEIGFGSWKINLFRQAS